MDDRVTEITCRFGDFSLDLHARTLFRPDPAGLPRAVPLGSRAWDILRVLIEHEGAFVSKQEMMNAVWPDVVVEENNLTVQMSALRRVLDHGRSEGSCIQTVAGRGYRLVPPVIRSTVMASADATAFLSPADDEPEPARRAPPGRPGIGLADQPALQRRWTKPALWGTVLCLPVAALLIMLVWQRSHFGAATADPPRLSVVVLPFQNLSGNRAEDYLAEGLTLDLTSDLAHLPGAFVIANSSARSYGHRPADVRTVGRELGVRYAVEGSVQQIGDTLQVNAALVSTESGEQLWTDRFNEPFANLASGREEVLSRMRDGLGISLIDVEAARALHEHPTSPDAFDLLLRGESLRAQPYSTERREQALALFEQALILDPNSVEATVWVARSLLGDRLNKGYWPSIETRDRVEMLMIRARTIDPDSESVHVLGAWWQFAEGRCRNTITTMEQQIELYPNNKNFYVALARCEEMAGHAGEAIDLLGKARLLSPRDPVMYLIDNHMGFDSMLLGRDQDAIQWTERSLAVDPDAPRQSRGRAYRVLAAVYARNGQDAEAHRAAATANRLWPFDTVRDHYTPPGSDPVFAAQMRRYQDALRLSGERDHADEDADFGVPADAVLHSTKEGYTPTSAPGAVTIRTADLVTLIDQAHPLVISTQNLYCVRSLPGAIGLRYIGGGGTFDDQVQARLRRKVQELTGGNRSRPIVAVGWNAERFEGRNLALRLVALGYTNVYWYRGGREAWEANGLPETDQFATSW